MELIQYFPKKDSTKTGKEVLLKIPATSDVGQMQRFINELVEEGVPILKNEPVQLIAEIQYLDNILKEIESKKSLNIFAFYDNKLIGHISVTAGKFRAKHIGNLRISVSKDIRNEGVGQILMKEALTLSKEYLDLKKITLSVMDGNVVGIHLYEKMGFKEYGRLPKAYTFQGLFFDEILMYKDLDG